MHLEKLIPLPVPVMRNKFMQLRKKWERNSVTTGKYFVHFAYHKNVLQCRREYRIWTTTKKNWRKEKAFYLIQFPSHKFVSIYESNLFASFRTTFYLITWYWLDAVAAHFIFIFATNSIFHLTDSVHFSCMWTVES